MTIQTDPPPRVDEVLRIREPNAVRPLNVVTLFALTAVVAGGMLLLSAAESTALVDGAVEWRVESPLRAVVQLLCLNYQLPTIYAGEFKNYVLGIGVGVVLLAIAIAVMVRSPESEAAAAGDVLHDGKADPLAEVFEPKPAKHHIAPLFVAQALIGLYLLWSFASSRWSSAPDLAIGGSILLATHFLWSFGLGHGLNRPAACLASWILMGLSAISAGVAVWYFYGRNPVLSAKFPCGNPTFLAACLLPGILVALALLADNVGRVFGSRRGRAVVGFILALVALALCGWAFVLTGSRGPAVGLAVGILALFFFALRGRMKFVPVLLVVVIAVAGWFYVTTHTDAPSPTGRSATLRFRLYAWSYAWDMLLEKPITGFGQGGFALHGDERVAGDVLADPLPFIARVAHAHNEWLEVLADLGVVGFVLIVAALFLTIRAGMLALNDGLSRRQRWVLIGLMSSLVALVTEECFGVGLRITAVPTMFFTIIGLIWAVAGSGSPNLAHWASKPGTRRIVTTALASVVGLAVLVTNQQDFSAARAAYRSIDEYGKGHTDRALASALAAAYRLSPQRALSSRYRLCDTYVTLAERLQDRAFDRLRRADESQLVDARLSAMAQRDLELVDEHCTLASRELKELVSRSAGFMHLGHLDYRINLVRAQTATARGDDTASRALMRNAATALEREFDRQPFDPRLALDFVRLTAGSIDTRRIIETLARPLRHNRMDDAYVQLLASLGDDPSFVEEARPVFEKARGAISRQRPTVVVDDASMPWAPETLRLAAATSFMGGDHAGSAADLTLAAAVYERLAIAAPMGATGCFAELADAQFFSNPFDPAAALASAKRALALAPDSQAGRRMSLSIEQRVIHFHLAAGDHAQARRVLRKFAPTEVGEADLQRELGVRLRRLCESVVAQRGATLRREGAAGKLLAQIRKWIDQAVELSVNDAKAQYVAADLSALAGDADATAEYLRLAIQNGLTRDATQRLLDATVELKLASPALDALRLQFESATGGSDADVPQRTPPAPAEGGS